MRKRVGILVAVALLGSAGSSVAQVNDAGDAGWQFKVTPYFFMAGLDGRTGVKGVTTDVDVPLGEILDHLDMAFMMSATARKNRWILGLDAMYFKLSDAGSKWVTGPFGFVNIEGTIDLDMTEQLYQPTIGYRLFEGTTLDLYAAARYTGLKTAMTLTSTTTIPSLPGGTNELDADVNWWDPVIGFRTDIPFKQKFDVMMLGDFGGFGVGSDVAYQWMIGAGWQFSQHFDARLGYRYFFEDYDQDGFVWHMAMSGAVLGLGISF